MSTLRKRQEMPLYISGTIPDSVIANPYLVGMQGYDTCMTINHTVLCLSQVHNFPV